MKKFLFVLMALFMATSVAMAQCNGDKCDGFKKAKGGFIAQEMKPMSVSEVLKMPDDSRVLLEGYIVKQLSKDKYEFTDGTNTLVVEIDDDKWHGNFVSPKDKVLLMGKVDDDDDGFSVDVKRVKKIQ